MQRLHERLCERYSWYQAWHNHPTNKPYHWTVFIYVACFLALVIISAATLTFSSAAAGLEISTYYIDPLFGNDNNSGLHPQTAWRTLAKVASFSFSPGDKILLRRGAVFTETLSLNSSGAVNAEVTVGAYGQGSAPVVTAHDRLTGWVWNSANKYLKQLTSLPSAIFDNGAVLRQETEYKYFNAASEWYYNDGTGQVEIWTTDGLNPEVHDIRLPSRPSALSLTGQSFIIIQDLKFIGSTAMSTSTGAVGVIRNGTHITIQNSEFRSALGTALMVQDSKSVRIRTSVFLENQLRPEKSGFGLYAQKIHDLIVANNVFKNNLGNGLALHEVVDAKVFGNQITENHGSGLILTRPAFVTVEGNTFHNNGQEGGLLAGIWIEDSLGQVKVRANRISGQRGQAGIAGRGAQDSDLTSNVLYGNQNIGIEVTGTYGLKLLHNTIYGLGESLTQVGISLERNRNTQVLNNLVFEALQRAFSGQETAGELVMDYNNWAGRKEAVIWNGRVFERLTEFVRETGYDSHSKSVDPQFASIFAKDFQLSDRSELIDAGTSAQVTSDFAGVAVPQGRVSDIGAYEFRP